MTALVHTDTTLQTEQPAEELIVAKLFCDDLYWLHNRQEAHAENMEIGKSSAISLVRFFCFVGRRGHATLGMTFDEFCNSHDMSAATGYRKMQIVRASMIAGGMTDIDLVEGLQSAEFKPPKMISRDAAIALCSLKDPVLMAKALGRYALLVKSPLNSPEKTADLKEIRNIVGNILIEEGAVAAPSAALAAPPVSHSATVEPAEPVSHNEREEIQSGQRTAAVDRLKPDPRFVVVPESLETAELNVTLKPGNAAAIVAGVIEAARQIAFDMRNLAREPVLDATQVEYSCEEEQYYVFTVTEEGAIVQVCVPEELIREAVSR